MEQDERIKFVYNEAAAVVTIKSKNYLVVGDLHIGMERKLSHKGIHIHEALGGMVKKIKELAEEFGANDIIILGDVKESILYPDYAELSKLKEFFEQLKEFNIIVTIGNHDPHLDELVKCTMVEELIIGDFAFLHGHRWPTEAAMGADYILAGHNHVAISIMDKQGGLYVQKGWLIAKVKKKKAAEKYREFNKDAKLVVMPAFNDLITGMPVNEKRHEDNLSPLFRNEIFDYKNAEIYSLHGDLVGTPRTMKSVKYKRPERERKKR